MEHLIIGSMLISELMIEFANGEWEVSSAVITHGRFTVQVEP